jgi:hypothetical protein
MIVFVQRSIVPRSAFPVSGFQFAVCGFQLLTASRQPLTFSAFKRFTPSALSDKSARLSLIEISKRHGHYLLIFDIPACLSMNI